MTLPKLLLFLSLPLYVLDQVTKFWTIATFPLHGPPEHIGVIEGWFHLVRVHNQGVAFGFGNGTAWAPIVFLIVPVVALTLIRVFWKKGLFAHPLSRIAVALLICGIIGNLTDRLVQGFLLEEIREAWRNRQPEEVSRLLHIQRGSLATLGAVSLLALCLRIEEGIRLQQADRIEPLLDDLDREFRALLDALQQWLRDHPPGKA